MRASFSRPSRPRELGRKAEFHSNGSREQRAAIRTAVLNSQFITALPTPPSTAGCRRGSPSHGRKASAHLALGLNSELRESRNPQPTRAGASCAATELGKSEVPLLASKTQQHAAAASFQKSSFRNSIASDQRKISRLLHVLQTSYLSRIFARRSSRNWTYFGVCQISAIVFSRTFPMTLTS
jgi:hypothetical protein